MAESFGVEDHGAFYDSVGALRDVMQNHLLQMVASSAWNSRCNEAREALRDEAAKVPRGRHASIEPEHFMRGQYDGYHGVTGVKRTPTPRPRRLPARHRLAPVDDVPFFLRASKAMGQTVTEMTLEFARRRPLWIAEHSHVARNWSGSRSSRRASLHHLAPQATRARRWMRPRSPWRRPTSRPTPVPSPTSC